MVSQALIQSKINYGLGKAANILGAACNQYRPSTTAFISSGTLIGTPMVYFDPKPNFKALVPSTFAHPQWYIAADRTNFQIADLFVDPLGNVYFVNILEPLLPTGAILCNATMSIYSPGDDQTPGPNYYGGNPSGFGELLVADCPCSMLQGTKGERDDSGVIAEGRQPWIEMVMPDVRAIAGVPDVGYILIDNQGRRYSMSSIETTVIGIRVTAQYAGT